ncbi:MAG: glycosyltransferase [Phycisphaerales bacterium JB039]
MRILLVNWARPWEGTRVGGGVNGYLQGLALALIERGHEVSWLCSGTICVPGGGASAEPGPCEIRRHDDWLGLRVFEVVNSPVLAPALLQFEGPETEVSAPELEARFADLIGLLRPEVVHFHNIEGLSAGCVSAARLDGARVFWSLHNYHPLCPQVYLMRGHRAPCHTFESGRACEGCIEAPDPAEERRRRAAAYPGDPAPFSAHADAEPEAGPRADAEQRHALPVLRWLGLGRQPTPPAPAAPGRPIEPEAAHRPQPRPLDHRGQTDRILAERAGVTWFTPQDPTWTPLTNDVRPDRIEPNPNRYGRRRAAMLEALGACDGVLAVSEHVRARYQAMGVPGRALRTLHIGTVAGDIAQRRAERLFAPPPFDPNRPRPLRLVFMGANHWYKGLSMLADSLDLLDAAWLRRLALTVVAAGGASIEYRFRRMEPRLASLRFHQGYEPPDIPWICGGQDIGIVPSVWWDNGPQTVMEYLACGLPVLGADIGGIPDFVTSGVNGLLFRANDRFDLARTLAGLIDDPRRAERLRAGVRPPKTMAAHAAELEQLYREGVSSIAPAPP